MKRMKKLETPVTLFAAIEMEQHEGVASDLREPVRFFPRKISEQERR